jgi:hypothetical protein
MPAYRVSAPLVLVRDEEGRTHHCYEGSVVDVVDSGHAYYLLKSGMVSDVNAPEPSHAVDTHTTVSDPDQRVARPPHVAAKAVWVDYAVVQGFDRVEAESMTKEQLVTTLS